ncbi:F0F1 ATP synthase subunit A [Mesorhizobium koreense]|uniref:F0F1 ATP synthase subunit A n=1 Tax=Mesorhizobium koreense TaxID=3074855 RepID=UPI00287B5F4F|nr:F0F1 ATP synthase subunit A [Mesorhizobium sp. WR6]
MAADRVDPIHQFHINTIVPIHVGGYDLSFTNFSLFMVIAVVLSGGLLYWATSGRRVVPSRSQSVAEMTYEFSAAMLKDSAGNEGMRFFPFIFTLFVFVLMANLLGMFPYFPTVTSQLIVTVALALVVFFMVMIAGFIRHGFRFFKLFVPSGIPVALLPLVVAIEIISFFTRPVSHSVRLFANMLAGHITVKVFAGFIFSLGTLGALGIAGAILPLIMVVGLTALEILIAFLQAYVFAMLACIYINDAIHPGH